MIKTILSWLALAVGLLCLVYSAWLGWQSDYLSAEIDSDTLIELNEKLEPGFFPSFVSAPLKKALQKSIEEPNVDIASLLQVLELYLQRNPLDANAWLYGSQFYQRLGDVKSASSYLAVAHRLSERTKSTLLKVFNRYLEMGLVDQAVSVAHDIAVVNPGEFRRLFYLMGRLSKDYGYLVNELIPKEVLFPELVQDNDSSENNIYYDWALVDAMRSKNTSLADEVWKVIPLEQKKNSVLGVKYLNYLADLQRIDLIESVWSELISSPASVGRILNDGDGEASPCWQVKENESVEVDVASSNHESALLKVVFLGEANVNLSHMSCLVLVQPQVKYKLTGRYKAKNISTLSGPFVDVHFPGKKEGYGRIEDVIGSSPWNSFELSFEVPDNTYIARIRVRRNRTELLDSKISGTVWFDSFELSEMESN